MTPEEFTYWLQGWVEMEQGKKPTVEQWKMITSHLNLVFNKLTPTMDELLLEIEDGEGELDLQEVLEAFVEDLNTDPREVSDEPSPTQFVPGQGQRPLPAPYPVHHFQPGPRICSGAEPDLSKEQYCCSSDSTPQDDWAEPRVLPK